MRRETHYGQNQMPNLPDEYLLTLSDDSDYCSSDWESETDTELDPDEMKKEGRLGWGLFIFTIVYLAVLITAYIVTTDTPLCVCHDAHPEHNISTYMDYCDTDKYKLEEGSIKYKKCTQYIKETRTKIDDKMLINDTFDGENCTMQLITVQYSSLDKNYSENQFIFSCNEHLYDVEEVDGGP